MSCCTQSGNFVRGDFGMVRISFGHQPIRRAQWVNRRWPMVAKVPSKAALALHSWLGTRRIRQNDLPMAKPPDHVSGRTAFTKFALYVVSERAPNLALCANA